MEIKFYGHACFSIEDKSITILMDPFNEDAMEKIPDWKADVLTISHDDPGHNNVKDVKGTPMLFRWPGEYETKGVHFKSIHSLYHPEEGEKEAESNIFVIHFSGIKFCHLGAQGSKLSTEQLEQIGDVDVLFVPVGGQSFLNAKKAKEVVEQIEPRIVIPMLYSTEGNKKDLGPLTTFLSEMGSSTTEPMDSFKFKKSELPEDNSKVIVLNISA